MWEVIRDLVRTGSTLLLTTQYLEEADALADEIAVVDAGRIIALGTADQLNSQVGGERVEVVVRKPDDVAGAREVLARSCGGDVTVDEHARRLTAPTAGGTESLVGVLRALDAAGIPLDDVGLRRPTLDDVFLTLTGHSAEDGFAAEDEPAAATAGSRS
jgi:ABC-2 type transport system ATP-binding protein